MKKFYFRVTMGARDFTTIVHADTYSIASNIIHSHYPRSAIISPTN